MLPLDKFTEAAASAVREKGLSLDDMTMAVRMDLDFDGNFGESWLVYEKGTRLVHRLLGNPDSIPRKQNKRHTDFDDWGKIEYASEVHYLDSFSMDYFSDLSVDTCLSSTRLLTLRHETPRPEIPEETEREEKDKILEEWNKNTVTEIKAQSTNATRQRLFAFCELIDRFLRGDDVTEEDQIFEQFNAKCPKCGRVYENQFRRVCKHCQNKNALISRLLEFLKPYKWQVGLVILCMFASSAVALVSPILSGKILYDRVIDARGDWHNLKMLFAVLTTILALALLSLLINIVQNRTNAKLSTRMMNGMKKKVFGSMLGLSLSYFNNNPTGRLINRVNYDAERIRSFYIDGVPNFVFNSLNFIGLTFFLFFLNWKLTLIVFIPVPITLVIRLNRVLFIPSVFSSVSFFFSPLSGSQVYFPLEDCVRIVRLMPALTGRVGSIRCRCSVISFANATPSAFAGSDTSLPILYRITLGWLKSRLTRASISAR